ncbi:hypothetical protein DOTSEDRAFT_74497 [Dothistroma septosporum NZE10]|uniref:Uncharacterized protein n=1 Tax=Dothistroma septosporum (strain NZE10 / CBS 128990) TaxID=675120 RepID=N1PEA8_DOTSN|nr:hypothetical protein DOTSEDRAFT_74497 [Dothistroma septosporum NZE10]
MSAGGTRSIRDATKALQTHFGGSKIPLSLPSESRRMLQAFIDEHDGGIDDEEASRANQELKQFWDKYIGQGTQKLGAFIGVLKELRPAIVHEDDLLEWYYLAAKPIVSTVEYKKPALEDAQDFIASLMIYDEDDEDAKQRARTSTRICNDLLGLYISRTKGLGEDEQFVAPDNAQISRQAETVLVAFARKMPKHFFNSLDDLIVRAETRLQGLTLLSAFLQNQVPHLYNVMHTPLMDDLLKCLMNDTSTTILSVALTSLIMLMPHIPGSLGEKLPRLFLVYSRLLCWEKFSPLSTAAQKSLVTDDRIPSDSQDHGDVGIDPTWERARPRDDTVEATTPEVMTYFTYLYGLYPLNFMSYVRKPRRFLKNLEFPGADEFDLDQTVIRSRTDQYRQAHLLHPNFFNMTIEEELIDTKWPKMDPADVVAECHALSLTSKPALMSPGPPPTGRLPDLPPLPPIPQSAYGTISPAMSHTSLRSGSSWRDTQSTAVSAMSAEESPVLGPADDRSDDALRPKTSTSRVGASPMLDEFPLPGQGFPGMLGSGNKPEPKTNIEYLQQKIVGLQNDLNFERWHKAQYSSHIGQMMRKNVKDATVEAETLNLINANRALKQQLDQVRNAREATIKDSNLTRKQTSNLEANLTERFNKMKKEQEIWAADADELKRLRSEMKHYRDLLSTAEACEVNKSHQLEVMKRDLEQLHKLQKQLTEAQRKVREYEYREFDFDQAKREMEILQSEKETMQMRLQRHDHERERTKRVYADRLSELEAQVGVSAAYDRSPASLSSDSYAVQQALADAQAKLTQLKKAHSRLLERHTDLELEYQTLKSQFSSTSYDPRRNSIVSGYSDHDKTPDAMSGGLGYRAGVIDSIYELASEYDAPSEANYTNVSASDPGPKRYPHDMRGLPISPISPPRSEATFNSAAGLTWNPPSRTRSTNRDSIKAPTPYMPTAPLAADERSVISGDSGKGSKDKLSTDKVRVYGRGGAQTMKLKPKEREQPKDEKKKGFKALKGIAGL